MYHLLILVFFVFTRASIANSSGYIEDFNLSYQFSSGFFKVNDKFDNSELIRTNFSLRSKKNVNLNFSYHSAFTFSFLNGYSSSRFGSDNYDQGFNLDEVYGFYQGLNFFALKFGAINQEFHKNELLISNIPFPALVLELTPLQDKTIQIILEKAIPTSRSLNSTAVKKEETPSFLSGSIFTHFSPLLGFYINFSASYFRFQNLPHKVAYDSGFHGNTSSGFENNSLFEFDYEGVASGANSEFTYKGIKFGLEAKFIRNHRAKESYGEGRYFSLNLEPNDFLELNVFHIYNESDSSLALYNSTALGHNNVKGLGGGILFKTKKNINYSLRLLTTDIISDSAFRGKSKQFSISMETPYANF